MPLNALAVCSDAKVPARSKNIDEDISAVDLPLPATTSVDTIVTRLKAAVNDSTAMTVVFSTYQSNQVVADAQKQGGFDPFDLIVSDEAHRATGVTLAGSEESAFVRVHDDSFIQGRKRLYMTATPRIYDDTSQAKAGEANAILASMDNEDFYGPEFHRLGFGEAVDRKLLTDYKVLVLAVDEKSVAKTFQLQLEQDGELHLDDAAKIVGCWNGLAKRGTAESVFAVDPLPMKRAVAFCGTIKDSKLIQRMFSDLVDTHNLDNPDDPALSCEVRHVDGSYNALERNTQLDWLRADVPDGECRILTNARCLSEGVDVPSLDAVMFLSPRKSQVDVVQSVGRVMRRPPKGTTKNYGYIILPIGVPCRHVSGAGPQRQQALRRRVGSPARPARPRRALRRDDQQDRPHRQHRRQADHREVRTHRRWRRLQSAVSGVAVEHRRTPRRNLRQGRCQGRLQDLLGGLDQARGHHRPDPHHPHRSTLGERGRRRAARVRPVHRWLAREPQRRHHRNRRNRDAVPTPHHPTGVRRPVLRLRLRRTQPGRPVDGADAHRARRARP